MKDTRSTRYEKVGDRVSIFRRDAVWYVNFQHGRKQRRQSLKTTSKKEARRRAIRLESRLIDGEYAAPKKVPTIQSVTDAYISHLRTEQKARKTLQKIELVVSRVLALANRRRARTIVDVDLAFIDEYRANRVEAGAAPKTLLNESTIIRQVVNFALSRKLIREDPLAGLKLAKVKSTEQPCWTWAQAAQVLQAAHGWHRDALTILRETGMRVGEAKWLTWADVDLANKDLHIRPKDGWRPKSGDRRTVPISPALEQLLSGLPHTAPWVIAAPPSRQHPTRNRQFSERRLLAHLKRILQRLGLKGHLHTFRHTFISHALTSGIAESIVRSWVGHVDAEIMRHYTHIHNATSQAAMAALAGTDVPTSTKTSGRCSTTSPRRPGRGSAQTQHTSKRSENETRSK